MHIKDPAYASPRLDTWDAILERLGRVGDASDEAEKIALLIELLVNLRLLGQDEAIRDRRTRSGDIESIYAALERRTRETLDSVAAPSAKFIYYAREVLKKLPVRQDSENMIEQIRMAAEAFEEDRAEDDPMRGFAGDLRKEVHRRLSPRIISAYLDPYLALVEHGDPEPIMRAGYVALPSRFSRDDESSSFIDIANDLHERLSYLWDYGAGDLAEVKRSLSQNMPLFERCFLKAEMQGFLEMLTPECLSRQHLVMDMLRRIATFKRVLKESYGESRIGLYDMLLVDLSLGRLIFLLANDLTNNHFLEVTPRNGKAALGVIGELLNISTVKGLAIGDVERRQRELEDICERSTHEYIRAKRCLGSICDEVQRYLQSDIIGKMSGTLNRVLEAYEVPTSRLSPIKTRFFNNFIRRTQIHVLSEFVEKVTAAVDKELERQSASMQLYADYREPGDGGKPAREYCVAATWRDVDDRVRPTLGGKGNGLIDMARLGLRVPPAFILGFPLFASCEADDPLDETLVSIVDAQLAELERRCGRRLGDPERPLIVSVRSGAPVSMPGVMITVLNVGLVPEVREALGRRAGAPFANSLYRRFLENCAGAVAARAAGEADNAGALPDDLEAYLTAALGPGFLSDPRAQLLQAIRLVYASRKSRAVDAFSRTLATNVRADTAVTVQRMVFGNLNEDSLSGVVITRNPITGEDCLFGDFKWLAQGEEVVMGSAGTESIAGIEPGIAVKLDECKQRLVEHFKQDLDLEFTVEDGELYLLQTRAARLGAFAQLVADTDFLKRGLIDLGRYRNRLERLELANASVALPRADFRSRRWNPPLTVGVPINGGVVSGTLVLTEERLQEAERRRESVVYFAHTTKPTDFTIMNGAHAIVTVYPGRTSHAAITAMSINKPCIVGCDDAEIDLAGRRVVFHSAGSVPVREGERVTADGNTGAVYRGLAPISEFFLPISSVSAAARAGASADEVADAVRALIADRMSGLSRETNLRRAGIEDARGLEGRRVLVRVDANVGIADGRVVDPESVRRMAPTLRMLLDRGATPVVCSHIGDPGAVPGSLRSREELYYDYSLRPAADILSAELGGRFAFHETSVGSSGLLVSGRDMEAGSVNLLENLRFATGEKDNDETFSRSLAELGEGCFINDAFNVCHRRHASITGVPRFCERRLAGPLVARELAVLETLLDEPAAPFVAVFCGDDISAQFGVMAALLPRVARLAVLDRRPRADPRATAAMIESLSSTFPDRLVLQPDQGDLSRDLDDAGTVLWAGPAHIAEGATTEGEAALRRAIDRGVLTVVCSEEDRYRPGVPGSRLHLSSGPRAFLEYMERMSLPGITMLDPAP
jgi:3-phosphoglycerate kinase/phosphohistidine swiveling domain-containing protein